MRACGQHAPSVPTTMIREERLLSAHLIIEEAVETCNALGVEVNVVLGGEISESYDQLAVIDGLCDLHYVTAGVFARMGVPDVAFHDEVHKNNMLKVERGTIDSNGKLIKPSDHQPPDLEGVLNRVFA